MHDKYYSDTSYDVSFIAADPDANYQSGSIHGRMTYVATLIAICAGIACVIVAYKRTRK